MAGSPRLAPDRTWRTDVRVRRTAAPSAKITPPAPAATPACWIGDHPDSDHGRSLQRPYAGAPGLTAVIHWAVADRHCAVAESPGRHDASADAHPVVTEPDGHAVGQSHACRRARHRWRQYI